MSKSKKILVLSALLVCGLLAVVPQAAADTATFNLTIPNSQLSGTYPPGTLFGTVTLTLYDNTTHASLTSGTCPVSDNCSINVDVEMAGSFKIFGSGQGSGMFGFNIQNGAAVTVSGLPAGDSVIGSNQMSSFGTFQVVINGPNAAHAVSSLTFTVSLVSGSFSSVSQFVTNSDGHTFAAHVWTPTVTADGNLTGFVTDGSNPVPEPGSLALLGSGMMALGGWFRRRRKAA